MVDNLITSPELAKKDKKELIKKHPEAEKSFKYLENQNVIELLKQKEKPKDFLDIGFNKEKDSIWFGFNLAGREAVVLNNSGEGKVLRNTAEIIKRGNETIPIGKNEIRELFDYEGYIGNIAPTIANETIKEFIIKGKNESLVNPKAAYEAVKNKILYYMDFGEQEEIADVLACWIIATYCYPIFYWFPHLLFNAPSASGKSKAGFIVKELSFRGFDLGASGGVTPPQIFRTLEGNRGTLFIDEFEMSRIKDDTQRLVNQILNASATRDSFVIRTEQINNKWKAWKFPIYSPKIVCNITGINPTSLSRFIWFKWLKTASIKGSRKPYKNKDKKSFEPIRENLYLLLLENSSKIKKINDELDISKIVGNREEDNWIPLFTIARFIDGLSENDKVETQLKKYLESYKDLEIETNDDTLEFFRILYEKVSEEGRRYTPKEIGEWVEVSELFSYLKRPANRVGKLLKLYSFKQVFITGSKYYQLSKSNVERIIELYGTKQTQLNNTNNTNQHQQHQIKPNTTKSLQKKGETSETSKFKGLGEKRVVFGGDGVVTIEAPSNKKMNQEEVVSDK